VVPEVLEVLELVLELAPALGPLVLGSLVLEVPVLEVQVLEVLVLEVLVLDVQSVQRNPLLESYLAISCLGLWNAG